LILFHPNGIETHEVPGVIQYIFNTVSKETFFAVQRHLDAPHDLPDPYKMYPYFPAKIYQSNLAEMELVKVDWVVSHFARWTMMPDRPDIVVVLSLSKVDVELTFDDAMTLTSRTVGLTRRRHLDGYKHKKRCSPPTIAEQACPVAEISDLIVLPDKDIKFCLNHQIVSSTVPPMSPLRSSELKDTSRNKEETFWSITCVYNFSVVVLNQTV
jgi:hypothetical protein